MATIAREERQAQRCRREGKPEEVAAAGGGVEMLRQVSTARATRPDCIDAPAILHAHNLQTGRRLHLANGTQPDCTRVLPLFVNHSREIDNGI